MINLTYSPVGFADMTLLCRALNLRGCGDLEIHEELKEHRLIRLTIGDLQLSAQKVVVEALAKIANTPTGSGESERLLVKQWIDFAYDKVVSCLATGRDIEKVIYEPLQVALARRSFLATYSVPTIADWTVFSLLFPKIKSFVPSIAAKYYRLIRWSAYLQSVLMSCKRDQDGKDGVDETADFVPAVFDFDAIRAELESAVDKKATTIIKAKPTAKTVPGTKPKAERQVPAAKETLIACHPFARVDLRVGKILKVEKHPNADRLYVETVDLGESEPRIVVSGLVEHVPIAELQDRLCLFICNLKPATLCKVLSSAMLLVAKTEDGGQLEPLSIPAGAVAGDRITIEGVEPQPDAVIKPKEDTWEKVRAKLSLKNGTVYYESLPLTVGQGGRITSEKILSGIVS